MILHFFQATIKTLNRAPKRTRTRVSCIHLLRTDYPGRRLLSHRLPWAVVSRAFSPFTLPLVSLAARHSSFFQEQLPLRNAVCIADERRHRQRFRRARHTEQFQAGFVRQAVALARVHSLVRPHEICPFVLAATRTR